MRFNLFFLVFILEFILTTAGRDFYNILGVSRSATTKQIKKAFRELSKKYHPDKTDKKEHHAKYMEVSDAYAVLSDDEKRRIYDNYGEEGLKDGASGGGGDPFDFFGFGGFGGFGRQSQRERKGHNIEMTIEVTLEELFSGASIDMEVSRQEICTNCRGSGAKDANDVHDCHVCRGSGVKTVRQMLAPGFYQSMQSTCDNCGGAGKIVKSKCSACDGRKVTRGSREIAITVERGMADGEKIVFENGSDQSPDYQAGDLVITLKERKHNLFKRKADNLYTTYHITLKEALLGFSKKINHLDGSTIELVRTTVTQPGFVQMIEQQGMPNMKFPSERGHLYIEYKIVLPNELNSDLKEVLETYL